MPDSFEALLVIFFAVLPGATFVYAMERHVGAGGAKAADRILRFVTLSAVLYLVLIPYGYLLYRIYILSGKLTKPGGDFPWTDWLQLFGHWLFLLGYFGLLPWLLGTWLGSKLKEEEDKGAEGRVTWMLGHHMRPPRAFEHLFARDDLYGVVRMLIAVTDTTYTWVAGSFSDEGPTKLNGRPRRAYVSTFPEEEEIYLPIQFRCNPTTGEIRRGRDGKPVPQDIGILVNADKIAYLEFIDG